MLKRDWVSVAASGALVATAATAPLMTATTANAVDAVKTVNYGSYLLDPPDTHFQARNWDDVWDLTKGDATVSYTIDMNGIVQPESWYGSTDPATYPDWFTPWVEVGMRGARRGQLQPRSCQHLPGQVRRLDDLRVR